jgi:polyferredoxin
MFKESLFNRGVLGYLLALALAVFYYLLYTTEIFTRVIQAVWPGGNKWYFYGFLYTAAVLVGGAWFIRRNRRSRYQVIRTLVIMAVQVSFGFGIPVLMEILLGKDYYFSYLWPLKIEYFYPETYGYIAEGASPALAKILVAYAFLASLVAMPLLAFFLGKRWYCSWVCGCGGLANTFGDPWRHLSTKTRWSWRVEMVTIHTVLIFSLVTTAFVMARPLFDQWMPGMKSFSYAIQQGYGFFISILLAGTLGVIFYPVLGTRVWCRFFCPMAAVLGLIQQFGRYRITINHELCMACGNCSKYCEMGIDVRSYAMRGEPFSRASCVGCGLCQHVCPRGVLRLENAKKGDRQLI